MSSEFECLFRTDISLKSWESEDIVKCVTVNRKRSDGRTLLQVRLFVRASYTPTAIGVSLSSRQTRMLMELAENFLQMQKPNTWDEHLAPEGLHNLTGDAWIGVAKGGKEVLLMRKNSDGLKGVTLSVDEYSRMRQCFGAVTHLMFPAPCPKNVEIAESVAYEIRHVLGNMRTEKCSGCQMDLANQLGHECLTMEEDMFIRSYFEEATTRVNMPRLLRHVEYLHALLKCGNPLPNANDVKEYFKDCGWYVAFSQKESTFQPLLTSFDELHP